MLTEQHTQDNDRNSSASNNDRLHNFTTTETRGRRRARQSTPSTSSTTSYSWMVLSALLVSGLNTIFVSSEEIILEIPSPPSPTQEPAPSSPYSIIIDGGSTGSRLHVFEFVETLTNDAQTSHGGERTTKPPRTECIRRGSARAHGPLSAFARTEQQRDAGEAIDPATVAQHLLPAFWEATQWVPPQFHATTPVRYGATAGMRLLPVLEQDLVYDALYQGLIESPEFVFTALKRSDIATLSGEDEGYFGAVAANYLKGTVNADLELVTPPSLLQQAIDDSERFDIEHHHGPIGALDMGGSSTQIVFLPGTYPPNQASGQEFDEETCHVEEGPRIAVDTYDAETTTCHRASPLEIPNRLEGKEFFATSYLSYGVDQFRERLWNTWIQEHEVQQTTDCCDRKVIYNPCTFKGYEMEYKGYTLLGTGDSHACVEQVQRLIPHPELIGQDVDENQDSAFSLGSHVGGVKHPPVRGKFFAMSLYFFALDTLRHLSDKDPEAHRALNLSWPNPSIMELYNALDGFCSRSWKGDLEEIQHEAHPFTRAEVLPHRCLEAVYMVTLLRDGFGFHPESRDITFTFMVDGSEVEWSLGMALVLHAEEVSAKLHEAHVEADQQESANNGTCPSSDAFENYLMGTSNVEENDCDHSRSSRMETTDDDSQDLQDESEESAVRQKTYNSLVERFTHSLMDFFWS